MQFSNSHSLSIPFLRSDSPADDRTPWLTQDFEQRFQEALGREMSREERRFFGLSETASEGEPNSSPARPNPSDLTSH